MPSTGLVISQIYAGGGNTGATYSNDFVELTNISNASINLAGLSLQYAAATGTTWQVIALPNADVPPGGRFLVQLGGGGQPAPALPVTPDLASTVGLGATGGKLALVNGTSPGAAPFAADVIDFVGYGTANAFESAAVAAPSTTTSLHRIRDTDFNFSDFVIGPIDPQNAASQPMSLLSVSADAAGQYEGDSGTTAFTFTVTRSLGTSGSLSVNYAVSGASPSDFDGNILPAGTVNFADGETTQTITIYVATDTVTEANEPFTVSLSNPSNGSWIGGLPASSTIYDDDNRVDFGNLQFPSSTTDGPTLVYGRVFESGITEVGGSDSRIVAQLGYGTGNDPTAADWTWINATYNTQVGNDDEYVATLPSLPAGTYYYTFRYGISQGNLPPTNFVYGDLDGNGQNAGLSFNPAMLGVYSSAGMGASALFTTGNDNINLNNYDLSLYPVSTVNDALDGDDQIRLSNTQNIGETFDGGAGNDSIWDSVGNDVILGGTGNDIIRSSSGADTIDAGDGDDFVSFAGIATTISSQSAIQGGAGNDTFYNSSDITITVDFIASFAGFELYGGNGTIWGTSADNVIDFSGLAIYEILPGFTQTFFVAGDGNDTVVGTVDDDFIRGDGGNDILYGGDGNDELRSGTGDDVVYGGDGNDVIWAFEGGDIVADGGDGDDRIYLGDLIIDSYVDIQGGAGNDLFGVTSDFTIAMASFSVTAAGFERLYQFGTVFGDANDNVLDFSGLIAVNDEGTPWTIGTRLNGAGGNDTLIGTLFGDLLLGGLDDDVTYAGDGNDLVVDEFGNNYISGGNGHDYLEGGSGNDVIDGGADNDSIVGMAGNDTASYDSATSSVTVSLAIAGEQVTGGAGTDTLNGIENLIGSDFADVLTGNGSDNVIEGGDADDLMDAAGGSDTASYAGASAGVSVSLLLAGPQNTGGAGTDTLLNFENLMGSSHADSLTGDSNDNVLSGLAGNDTLSGGAGNDTLRGGAGNDLLDGGGDSDTASYADATSAVSVDLRTTGFRDTIGAGFDKLVSIENVIGSDFNDTLTSDTSVANELRGGLGNDRYNVMQSTDQVIELLGEGTADRIEAFANITLFGMSEVETIVARLTTGMTIGGSDTANRIDGNTGNDTLNGNGGDDTLNGLDGNDSLNGGNGNDVLNGGNGNDILNGGADVDTASYATASAAVTVSLLLSTAQNTLGAGNDTLSSIENLIGSAFNDTLTGSNGDNALTGGGGNDTINGRGGIDTMAGGAGDDRYFVDNAADIVIETGNQGSDRVFTTVNYTLGTGQTIEFLFANAGAAGLTLTGNELANNIQGNSGADTLLGGGGDDILEGRAGADDMSGGAGNDRYYIDNAGDAVHELGGEGSVDIVYSSIDFALGAGEDVERLYAVSPADLTLQGNEFNNLIFGSGGNDTLVGNDGADTLTGNGGDDRLVGGAGIDTLFGNAGADIFGLQNAAADRDTIRDFEAADQIEISAALFGGGLVAGSLAANQFEANATGVATTEDHRFVYNTSNGALYFDADGNGAGARVQIASLTGLPGIGAADFNIVA